MKNKELLSTTLLFLVAIIWGTGFIASQFAIDVGINPPLFMFTRFLLSTIIMGVAFRNQIKQNLSKKCLIPCIAIGVFLFLGFYTQFMGLKYTTVANNAFLTALNVIIVPIIVWIVERKMPSIKVFVAAILSIVGIWFLTGIDPNNLAFNKGDILTMMCAFFFAVQIFITGKYATDIDTTVIVFLQFLVATILSACIFFATDGNIQPFFTLKGSMSMLYLAVFSTGFAYFVQAYALKYVDSSRTTIILGTEGLFGTIFSVLLKIDEPSSSMFIGGIIITIALIIAEYKFKYKDNIKETMSNIATSSKLGENIINDGE